MLALRHELVEAPGKRVATFDLDHLQIEIVAGLDALWAIIRRPGKGGLAMRAAHAPGGCLDVHATVSKSGGARVTLKTVLGRSSRSAWRRSACPS